MHESGQWQNPDGGNSSGAAAFGREQEKNCTRYELLKISRSIDVQAEKTTALGNMNGVIAADDHKDLGLVGLTITVIRNEVGKGESRGG